MQTHISFPITVIALQWIITLIFYICIAAPNTTSLNTLTTLTTRSGMLNQEIIESVVEMKRDEARARSLQQETNKVTRVQSQINIQISMVIIIITRPNIIT